MGFRRGAEKALVSGGLIGCGAIGVAAWHHGLWGTFAGTIVAAIWLATLNGWPSMPSTPAAKAVEQDADAEDAMVLRVLLDSAPTPLLSVDAGTVRALNRAARSLFATDDRVLPPPPALLARDPLRCRYEGRTWRIDRVDVARGARMVVALIDIEQEERTADARATAEMIQVLGHEVLNGLAPIVSLAESGLAAATSSGTGNALLSEILGTLARRAEGLQRFTEAYRALARLPEPMRQPVSVAELVGDIARLFEGRWPAVRLTVDVAGDPTTMLDRDQLSQALWAILQNAAEAATGDLPEVSLTTHQSPAGLVIDITDNGAGILPGETERIFRPFHTTKPDGSGIGLSLARQIVHAHGGSLTLVRPVPATLRLVLPTIAA